MSFSSFLERCTSETNPELSNGGGTTWKDAIVDLVVRHQDLDKLLQEATVSQDDYLATRSDVAHPPDPDVWLSLSVDSISAVVRQRAVSSSNPLPLTAASMCASKVKDIVTAANQDSAPRLLLDSQTKGRLDILLQVVARLQLDQTFSIKVFIKTLNKQMSLPIGLIWRLHDCGIMPLDAYVTCNLSRPSVVGSLATDIARLCGKDSEDTLFERKTIVSDLVGYLVQHGYQTAASDDATARGMKKVSCALLDSIVKKVLSEDSDRDVFLHSLPSTTSADVLKSFFSRQLTVILSLNPLLKVSEALAMQKQWTYSRTPSYLAGVYRQLLSVFDVREAVDILRNVLEVQEVNWQAVLSFTASLLVCFPDAPALLQELISAQLSRAFEACELDGMITAFLLARQGCLEGAQVFPSYQHWFQGTFGNLATSPATNKKSFAFLIMFLTDVVPFEAALYLKAHLLSPPCVPAKCRLTLSDYVTLAKTRLSDLGESLEELGIFAGDQNVTNGCEREKAFDLAEQDVDKALSAFNKTGKVPASVLEASIFRKPYFVGRFLPSLLAPRPLPDVPDVRMRFIEALHKSDKMAAPLYLKYTTSCAQLSALLLEGVCDLDDDMDDVLLPPLDQLQHSLDRLNDLFHQSSDCAAGHGTLAGVTAQIAIVSEKIHLCLETEPLQNVIAQTPIHIDLDLPDIDPDALKVTDILLSTVCHIVMTTGCHDYRQCEGHPEMVQWLSRLLTMLTDHRPVLTTFCLRLFDLVTRQGPALQLYHVKGIAAIVTHLTAVPQLRKAVRVKSFSAASIPRPKLATIYSHPCGPTAGSASGVIPDSQSSTHSLPQIEQDKPGWLSLSEALLLSIPCTNATSMEFTLRLTTQCVEYALTSFSRTTQHEKDIPAILSATLVNMFAFIVRRLCRKVRLPCYRETNKTFLLAAALFQSEVFQSLLKDSPLSFPDWAEREIQISACEDCLSATDRQDYFDWTIQQHIEEPTQGCDAESTSQCAAVLMNVILDFDATARENDKFQTSRVNGPHNGHAPSDHDARQMCCHGNSRSEMLLLLQRLTSRMSLETTSSDEGARPWLINIFYGRLAHASEDECSATRHETGNFFRLVRCLPAHVLFTVLPPGGVVPRLDLDAVVDLVNSHFRNHLSDETGCCLDLSTTMFLLHGLIAMTTYRSCDVDHFIKACPLLVASVMWHWPNIVSHLPSCSPEGSAVQRLLTRVKKIHEFTTSEVTGLAEALFDDEDLSIVGVALCAAYCRHCGGETTQRQEKLILGISTQKTSLSPHQVDVILRSFQECTLSCLAKELILQNSLSSRLPHVLLRLWLNMPQLLNSLPGDHQMAALKLASPDDVVSLRPVACMRVLVKSTPDEVVRLTKSDRFISVLLQVYNQCCKLHDQTSLSGVLSSDTQVVGLAFMMEAAAFMRKSLCRVKPSLLQRLDKRLVESSDTEMQNMIKHFASK